jgi:hypothetical protein
MWKHNINVQLKLVTLVLLFDGIFIQWKSINAMEKNQDHELEHNKQRWSPLAKKLQQAR